MKRQLIVHTNLILSNRIEADASLLLEGGRIAAIFPTGAPLPQDVEPLDGAGWYTAPGLVDIHVHGGGGWGVGDSGPEGIVRMCEAHARFGTTSILPTTLAAPLDELLAAIDDIRTAQTMPKAANLLGVHLEGPFLSPAQCGAQNPRCLQTPSPQVVSALLDRWEEIRMMGAAPELPGGLELGKELKRRGIRATIAHSDCTFEEAERALESGYTDVTHLYSGCSTVRRVNCYRVAGLVEAGLFFEGLTVQVIADGKHLPPSLLKLIYRCKGPDRISLITDGLSHSAMELAEGTRVLQANGVETIYEDGVFKLPDRQAFAGSAATMAQCLKNMVELAQVPLVDAVKMASTTPARLAGASAKGEIAVGKDADLVFFGKDLTVTGVMVLGKLL